MTISSAMLYDVSSTHRDTCDDSVLLDPLHGLHRTHRTAACLSAARLSSASAACPYPRRSCHCSAMRSLQNQQQHLQQQQRFQHMQQLQQQHHHQQQHHQHQHLLILQQQQAQLQQQTLAAKHAAALKQLQLQQQQLQKETMASVPSYSLFGFGSDSSYPLTQLLGELPSIVAAPVAPAAAKRAIVMPPPGFSNKFAAVGKEADEEKDMDGVSMSQHMHGLSIALPASVSPSSFSTSESSTPSSACSSASSSASSSAPSSRKGSFSGASGINMIGRTSPLTIRLIESPTALTSLQVPSVAASVTPSLQQPQQQHLSIRTITPAAAVNNSNNRSIIANKRAQFQRHGSQRNY